MLLWLLLFAAFLVLFGGPLYWVARAVEGARRKRLKRLLTEVGPLESGEPATVVLHTELPSTPPIEQALMKISGVRGLQASIRRTGLKWSTGGLLALSLATAAAGALGGALLRDSLGKGAMIVGAGLGAALPLLYVKRKDARLQRKFEEQLPEALDFLARSVRAGNALSVSIEMLISEVADPLRSEFRRVSREQALGSSIETALKNLVARVPLIELRFFVAVVLLQRETGGNLGEILTRLSASIRERLRLKAQITAVSSQGRLTARVLSILPVVVILGMNLVSPAYMRTMTHESIGRTMLLAAVVSQLLGYFCMKKITDIEI